MAPPRKHRALSLWMNGEHVGEWRLGHGAQPMELVYAEAWLASPSGRGLSTSLPLPLRSAPLRGPAVAAYFDNLLPDYEPIRRRIAARHQLPDTDPFTLLTEIGRDCVGALQLLPHDASAPDVRRIEGTALDAQGVEALIDAAITPAAGIAAAESPHDEELRISIAGAQDKTALLWHEGRWHKPTGATPTTHILKLPLGLIGGQRQIDFQDSVDNEWLCLQLMGELGLPVAKTDIQTFGRHRVLVVERFDRQLSADASWWQRLPQEDFCQVFALPPTSKYERDGGPGLVEIGRKLLRSVAAQQDLETLVASQVVFWLMLAIDGHAKNFSLRLLPQGRFQLTPIYDVLSAWPVEGQGQGQINLYEAKLAMSLRGHSRHRRIIDVRRRHFSSTARLCGLDSAEPQVERVLERLEPAIEAVGRRLPQGFAGRVFERITTGMRQQARRLADDVA